MAEEMRGQVLLDASTFTDDPELGDGRLVPEAGPPVVDEDRGVALGRPRVVQAPLDDVLPPCDDRDIPRNICLEIDIHHDTVLVEGEVIPLHGRGLPDPEPPLIDERDHGPVIAPVTGLVETLDLFGGQHLGGGLGHWIVRRDLDPPHFLLGEFQVLVFNQPDEELFQDPHEIVLGVLSEGFAFRTLPVFECLDAIVNIDD